MISSLTLIPAHRCCSWSLNTITNGDLLASIKPGRSPGLILLWGIFGNVQTLPVWDNNAGGEGVADTYQRWCLEISERGAVGLRSHYLYYNAADFPERRPGGG